MPSNALEIACNHCGADIRLLSIPGNGLVIGCNCTTLDSSPLKLKLSELQLPDDWHRFDDPDCNPWPSEEYREVSHSGGNDGR